MNRPLLAVAALLALPLVGCSENSRSTGSDATIAVTSSDNECVVEPAQAPAGTVVFNVTNSGSEVTEFYLLEEDGEGIVAEVENIGPGISRDLVVEASAGSYVTSCKPGMVGDGIQGGFTVSGEASGAESNAHRDELESATVAYTAYVEAQTSQLVRKTKDFAQLYVVGDDAAARALYAPARVHWERIEPVAESFGDLDPKLDLREADLEPNQKWTGWHAIEKDLWPPKGHQALSQQQREALAETLVTDTEELADRVAQLDLRPDQLGNGAKELLDEVATGKVTGEEEFWSHTDLWDFQANIDGARVAYRHLKPVVQERDPELADTLDTRFTDIQDLLNQHRDGSEFVRYTELTPAQVRELAAGVDALGEPLSQLTSSVLL